MPKAHQANALQIVQARKAIGREALFLFKEVLDNGQSAIGMALIEMLVGLLVLLFDVIGLGDARSITAKAYLPCLRALRNSSRMRFCCSLLMSCRVMFLSYSRA